MPGSSNTAGATPREDGRQWFEIGVSVQDRFEELAVTPNEAAKKVEQGFDSGDLEDIAFVEARRGSHLTSATVGEDKIGWEFDVVSFGVFHTPAYDEAEIGEATVKKIDTGDFDSVPSLNYASVMRREDVEPEREIQVKDWEADQDE